MKDQGGSVREGGVSNGSVCSSSSHREEEDGLRRKEEEEAADMTGGAHQSMKMEPPNRSLEGKDEDEEGDCSAVTDDEKDDDATSSFPSNDDDDDESSVNDGVASSSAGGWLGGPQSDEGRFRDDGGDESLYTTTPAEDSRFDAYHVQVDPAQDDRAADIPLFTAARPHMRGFHLAWIAFFVAFFTWFAMTPLLSEIGRSLDLTREEIWTSSVLAVASSAVTRALIGPLNDRFGARWIMCSTLVFAAVPTALSGLLVRDRLSLYLVRLFIGVAGSSFVTCQYWTVCMFTQEVAGTANALAAGWGNLGGGVAQIVMGSLLFPLFKLLFGGSCYGNCGNNENENDGDDSFGEYDRASDLAWRTVMVFPAILSLYTAWAVVRYGDDTPKGNVSSLRKRRRPPTNDDDNAAGSRRYQQEKTIQDSFRQGAANVNTWLLFIQYGCCFGVEITMTQGAALYFHEEFGQSTESAAAIASVFGWMNLFARGIGGFFSDMANAKAGLRGRLWVQVVMLLLEGAFVIIFSYTSTLGGAIVVLAFFSIFVQAAEGSTFGIVPYIDSAVTGSVAGLVGAGGNFGGAGFAYLLVHFDYRNAFLWMGSIVMASSLWTMFFAIPGHRSLLTGRDADEIVRHRHQAKLPAVVVFEIHGDAAEVSERIVSEREMEDEQDEEDGF